MKDKYQAMVLEDPHDPSLRWLRVTHNGYSYSTIRIDGDDEILQIINALQQSLHLTGGILPPSEPLSPLKAGSGVEYLSHQPTSK